MLEEFLSVIPRMDIEQACGHLKMFSASSAPKALVMLYMSPFRSNRSAADEAVRYFLTSIKSILPMDRHHECVPIILEFSHALALSVESFVDISDFSSFVAPLMEEIKGCDPIVVPLTEDLRGVPHVYRDELRMLYGIFHDFLSILESCLGKLEDRINSDLEQDKDALCIEFSYYLEFMKELNSISKIYSGCEDLFWEAMKKRKGAFCELVVKCAKRGEDHKSFESIKHAEIKSLCAGLFIKFKNEEAITGVVFIASKVDPMHLEYFHFTGKVIALALMHNIQVGVVFDRLFFMQLAGHRIALEDIRDADPLLYNSCKKILEMDSNAIDQDALGLTFVHEVEEFGTRKTVDLCIDGKSRAFCQRLCRHYGLLPSPKILLKCLELEDLDWMLRGSESAISVDDWKAHTKYELFKETDDQILWFWKIVGDMTEEQKKDSTLLLDLDEILTSCASLRTLPVMSGMQGNTIGKSMYETKEAVYGIQKSCRCKAEKLNL
ncbi:hypothetical protein SASPL_144714 [Salvia splendens]|uniref:HECT-type E3 ubiquitin transferase n=1 Tax=Salvia splendens TaxID=180675 RepID=A0A8X8WG91_SALSN|nr:hypothetical protein SASPL_144714 [Salvia splendens]